MSSYLKFQVQFHTYINQSVRIVGNIKDLGEWDPSKGLQLQTNKQIYPDWTHDTFLEVPLGVVIEFKCVKFEGDRLVKWENFHIDMNRKYKTQYFKALLFMKEDNIQVIERPFQKYTGNHDYDIIDTSKILKRLKNMNKFILISQKQKLMQKKFKKNSLYLILLEKQMDYSDMYYYGNNYKFKLQKILVQVSFNIYRIFHQTELKEFIENLNIQNRQQIIKKFLYKKSSSSDNSSLDFFRRQSKVSEDFNVIENQIDQIRSEGGAQNNVKKLKQKQDFQDDDFSSQDIPIKHKDDFQDPDNFKQFPQNKQQEQKGQKNKNTQIGLGIKFNQSSLNQIQSNVPMNLENIFLLFNRIKKESQLSKERYPTIRKIVDQKDINFYYQNIQHNKEQINQSNDDTLIKNIRNVKSLPYIRTQSQEQQEKTQIIVSYRLPYYVRNKKKKNSRISTDLSVSQLYDFIENFDPLIDSIYQCLLNVKLNLIWVGICNIYLESVSDQEDLRQYMLEKYRCYPLFYNEDVNQLFSRQFCSKFLHPQYDNMQFYEEEKCWQVYKDINMDIANVLKKLTGEGNPIFAIAIYDFHFFLVPSYFQKLKNQLKGHQKQFQQNEKIAIAFFMNRKFPQLQIFESLPQSEIFMHSLFFCDIMSFSAYESCEPFLNLSQKMGCAVLHKSGGKIILQCNGREILIRIEHPGINIKKLQATKDIISQECERRAHILHEQNKHQIIGIDSVSKNSGLEYKFKAFEKFLMREKQHQPQQEYKLKQIIYFSSDSEFHTLREQQEYLNEIKSLARSINQSHSFYDSAIEIIEGDTLSFEEYFQYLILSECFFSTVLQETRHFHYMEYLFLKKDGQLILSNCLNSISHFNTVNIVNPQDQSRIVTTLTNVFQSIGKTSKSYQNQLKNEKNQKQQSHLYKKDGQPSFSSSQSINMYDSSRINLFEDKKRNTLELNNNIDFTSLVDKSRINITEKNNTSDQAQREFDYNYLIKFCSSQNWINRFINDIVKRQSIQRNTCLFFSNEEKRVIIDKQNDIIHKENISKIYERNSEQFIEINLQNLIYRCKNSNNAVFIFGFSSVFFEHPSNLLSEPKLNTLLFKQIEELSKQPNVQIYIISGKSPELLSKYFGHINNIFLIANNGLKIQQTGQDLDFLLLTNKYEHTLWKMQVQMKMENFVQKTAGSYIIESEVQTSWHFENVEKEFADAQKNELIKQLVQIVESMPGNEIFEGYDFVQVRPQCLNKGVMTKIALQNSCLLRQKKIDFLVVVGGRKTTDEEMLKSARDLIYDENVAYVENNAPVILGSISSQLGALYCNHQFENNQELAILLEMMNGNKQILKSDQFINLRQLQGNSTRLRSNPMNKNQLQNTPVLLRNNTVCDNSYLNINSKYKNEQPSQIDDDEEENEVESLLDNDIKFKINFSPKNNSPIHQNHQKRQIIKIQDIKIPFISQTNSLNKINNKLI